ncbi:MAG: hypothetical protein JNM99_24345 [Verrucomicrobiaceae bacterium]|nr:hypothetical protein [Verrucomicrobiaceae bacterium]
MTLPTILDVLRANPGLTVALALCIGPLMVLGIIAQMMRRAGASLKPIAFIIGLMFPVIATFVVGQLTLARQPGLATASSALAVRDGRFADRERLFGPGISPAFIQDARAGLPGILDGAEIAEVGVSLDGATVLIAQFQDNEQARRAAQAYHRAYQLRDVSGDEEHGWQATRVQGDHIEMLRIGRHLFVWSGLTKEAAAERREATNIPLHFPALVPASRPPLIPALQPLAEFFAPTFTKIIGIGLLILIYTVLFFKGSAWATRSKPAGNLPALLPSHLVSRLMAINELDVPFSIAQGSAPNEWIADWRYADAKWIDLARAHGMKRTFRIRMTLDESTHSVYATDYTAAFDWSVGRQSASIQWQAAMGIMFFQREEQHVFGLQLDEQGRLKPEASYSYKFDLSEMKSPIQNTITQAGWTWRPTVWQGQSAVRWLTQ